MAATGSSAPSVHTSSTTVSGKAASSKAAAPNAATSKAAAPKSPTSKVKPHAYWLPDLPNLAGTFVPDGPTRLLDTREGIGTNGVIAPVGQVPLLLDVSQITGNSSIAPTAVVLNVTVTRPTTGGYLSVSPDEQPSTSTSNLNFSAGQTVANLVTVPVGYYGKINFYVSGGHADVVVDLAGYYTLDKPASTYVANGPTRVLDTRHGIGTGGVVAPVGAGKSISLLVDGVAGVPSTNVTAVVLNVTVARPSAGGYLTVYPDGGSVPTASNVNFTAGETVPNLVTVPVGADGKVDFYNGGGSTDVVADLAGYFVANAPQTGGTLQNLGLPTRLLDTRHGIGTGGVVAPVGAGKSISLQVDGAAGLPAKNVTAVALNVTVTRPSVGGYLTVYPDGGNVPTASNLNFTKGETVPNLVVVPVGADGKVDFFNGGGSTDVIADIFAYYVAGSDLTVSTPQFASSTVDASSGAVPVNVTWTVTDSNPALSTSGAIEFREQGGAADTYVGERVIIDYSSTQDLSGYGGASIVSQSGGSTTFSYTFIVPQYAGATSAKFVVAFMAAYDSAQQEAVFAGSALGGAGNAVTATEPVSTVTPSYDRLQSVIRGNWVGQGNPAYVYDGGNTAVQYYLDMQDWQSGFWKGSVTISGPGGRQLTGTFEYEYDGGQQNGPCQGFGSNFYSTNQVGCYATVIIPGGAPAGTWTVSAVTLTNNAGQTESFTGLNAEPITLTSNGVVSASGFAANPSQVNNWAQDASYQVSMHVSGAHGGVSTIEVYSGGGCTQKSTTPTAGANGVYSVPMTMYKANNGASNCTVNGIAITDGSGNLALYGVMFGLPDLGVTAKTIPDTTPPTVSSAALNKTSVPQSQIGNFSYEINVQATDKTAPIDSYSSYLYDSTGAVVDSSGGAVLTNADGSLDVGAPISYSLGLPVGTYHIGFEIFDAGGLHASYGMPGTPAVPGGPLTFTITAG